MTIPLNLAGIPITDARTGLIATPWLLYLLGRDENSAIVDLTILGPAVDVGVPLSLIDRVRQEVETLPAISELYAQIAELQKQVSDLQIQPVQDKGDLQELTVKANSIGYSSSSLACPTTYQVTGLNVPVNGAGIELAYSAGFGYVIAYDRTGAVYKDLVMSGASVQLGVGAANVVECDSALRVKIGNGGMFYPSTAAAAAQTGTALYAGSGAPNNANGANGDFYFRTDSGVGTSMYTKRAGAWAVVV